LNARLNYELNMEYLTDIVEKIQNKKESMKKLNVKEEMFVLNKIFDFYEKYQIILRGGGQNYILILQNI